MRVHAYAASAASEPLEPTTIERRAVGANDVLIEVAYAGICHSDIHTVNGDWGPQPSRSSPATRSSAPSPRSARPCPATRSATGWASAAW